MRFTKKDLSAFLCVLLMSLLLCGTGGREAGAQTSSGQGFVAGIVTDRISEEPITGVFVYFEGTTTGVMTDKDGYYYIKRPDDGGILIFL